MLLSAKEDPAATRSHDLAHHTHSGKLSGVPEHQDNCRCDLLRPDLEEADITNPNNTQRLLQTN